MSDIERINNLVVRQVNARYHGLYWVADQLRDELLGQGIIIKPDGTWEPTRWRALAKRPLITEGPFAFDLRGCLDGTLRESLAPALARTRKGD